MSEEEYVPEHPQLKSSATSMLLDHPNDLTKHVLTMFHLNSIPMADRESISKYVIEEIPDVASRHETARWCHIQHTLEHFDLIPDGVNAYCLKVLEENHDDIQGEKFFETITKGFKN